jgi:ferredoxin-thioredoxin reductase catalytic chain
MAGSEISREAVEAAYQRIRREAEAGGYHLNPDAALAKDLIKGLLINEARYGYEACPCRLASGKKADDLDIICPCDYRDPDLAQYGSCYCALYVSGDIVQGKRALQAIPERRPPEAERKVARKRLKRSDQPQQAGKGAATRAYPIWRCKVCGYLCARDEPPELCPICKAKKERFEWFM